MPYAQPGCDILCPMPAPTRVREVGASRAAAERFALLVAASLRLLPPPIRRAVPADMVGYVALGLVTFAVDLALLVMFDRLTPVPLAVAVVISDVLAWGLHFQLNRTLNFRSQAAVGPEAMRYGLLVVACLGLSAGITTAAAALGVGVAVSRIAAGGILALFGYAACRWWVFRCHHPRYGKGQPSGARPTTASTAIATNTSAR